MKRIAVIVFFLCAMQLSVEAGPVMRVRLYSSGVSQASLYWSSVPNAVTYSVERTSAYPAWVPQAIVGGSSWSQSGLATDTTYVYRVVPRDSAGNPLGTPSNAAIVNTHVYSDNPLEAGDSMALQYMIELRNAVGSIRSAAGAGNAVWTRTLAVALAIDQEDIDDLR